MRFAPIFQYYWKFTRADLMLNWIFSDFFLISRVGWVWYLFNPLYDILIVIKKLWHDLIILAIFGVHFFFLEKIAMFTFVGYVVIFYLFFLFQISKSKCDILIGNDPRQRVHIWNFPSPRPQAEGEGNFRNAPEDKASFPINTEVTSTNIRERATEIFCNYLKI